jgi:hypothetical protein
MSTTEESARVHSIDADEVSAIDYCYEAGWAADGLPVIPPERNRVESMLAMEGRPAETIVASHPTTGKECSILAAATNAVMAGCLPEYFPVVVAALEAADREPFNFHAAAASTGGSAPLLIVSGPIVEAIGMNSGAGVFAPGNRANATIGRTMRLILLNVFEMIPGLSDQSTHGTPAKYSFCIAERADANPWEPLNVELGYPADVSSVTVFAGSSFNNVENHGGNTPEAILDSIADSMGNLGNISIGESVVVLSPEHAEIVASTGFTRQDVKQYLFANAKRSVSAMKSVGKYVEREHRWQQKRQQTHDMHRGFSPDDILVTVAGGLAGGHSAFIASWSRSRASLMQSAPIGVCIDC